MNLDLNQMKSLALLAELGSIQAVAARRGVSPGAIHHQLKLLELEAGTKIYEKRGTRLELTDSAKVLLPFIYSILDQHDAASAALRDWHGSGTRLVRVGAGPSFSSYLLPTLLKRYRRKHPAVELYVETGTSDHLIERLRNGDLDLVFDLAGAHDREIVESAVWESEIGFIASPKVCKPRTRLSSLEKYPFILFQKESVMDTVIQGYFDGIGFKPKIVMRSDSAEAIKAMLRAEMGLAMLFVWNINPDLRTKSLTVVHTEAKPLTMKMALLKRRSAYTTRVVESFIRVAEATKWPHLRPAADDTLLHPSD